MSKTQVIKQFFGLHPQQKLSDFIQEMKDLTAADRLELAQLAAVELTLDQAACDFPLS